MKHFSFLVLFLSIYGHAQQFKPAVITLKNGEKMTGTIFYNTPFLTPQTFDFKDDSNKIIKLDQNKVKEVIISDKAKFIKAEFELSRHPENLQNLEYNPEFNVVKEEHFLEQITFGKYNLYKYADKENTAYFYSTDDSNTFNPLLFKEYFVANGDKGTDRKYLKELQKINCGNITFKTVRYIESSLIDYFDKINECNGESSIQYQKPKGYTEHKVFGLYSKMKEGGETGYGGGYEFEYHLPFLNYSFAIAAAPNFISYSENKELKYGQSTTKSIISLPVLFRYYPLKLKDYKLYVSYSILNFSQRQQDVRIYNNIIVSDNYFTAYENNFFELGLRFKNLEAFSRFHSAAADKAISVGLKYTVYSSKK